MTTGLHILLTKIKNETNGWKDGVRTGQTRGNKVSRGKNLIQKAEVRVLITVQTVRRTGRPESRGGGEVQR